MRTVAQIKKVMTDAFMANSAIKAKYDPGNTWTASTTFEDIFASTSVESIIFYIVAVVSWGLEYLMGRHVAEVEAMEGRMRVGGLPWWRQLCFDFQYGYNLVYNTTTRTYEYATVDDTAKVITHAHVRESGNGLVILVNSSDSNNEPIPLDPAVVTAFNAYLKKVKIAGIRTNWNTYNPDLLTISLTVKFNPLIMNSTGQLISTGEKTVETAIKNYLANLPYGSGLLNKTALIDAIQAATGVDDVYFTTAFWLRVKTDYNSTLTPVLSQNLNSFGGSFRAETITINYIANV